METSLRSDVVDMHAHFMPPDLPNLAAATGDDRWPRLVVDEATASGRVMLGDRVFRVVRPACWDVSARLKELDKAGVTRQVISPIPISLTYWGDARQSLEYAQAINSWLAESVLAGQGRLFGLATVPLQHPGLAISEMKRAVVELGLSGLEIGAVVDGMELDSSELRAFFRAADDLNVPIFVHPTDGDCATRVHNDQQIAFGLGMLTDTALAASALVFGGVLRECPNLKVCLSHGGGTFPWALPRLVRGGAQDSERDPGPTPEELARRLYVDTLVLDPEHIRILRSRFGVEHLVVGSDLPFFPLDPAPHEIVARAVDSAILTEAEGLAVRYENALRFLGLEP